MSMMRIRREAVATEIDRLRRLYLLRLGIEEEPPITWEVRESTLCWYVVLRDALEPDVDVEILEDVAIVRAAVDATVLEGVLPIPVSLRPDLGSIRFREGVLEVRLVPRAS
jgi:hypothetical protein